MLWFFSLFIFLFVLGEGGQGAAPGGTPTGAAAVGGPQEDAPGQPHHPGNQSQEAAPGQHHHPGIQPESGGRTRAASLSR